MSEKSLTFNLFGHDVSASSAVGEFASKAHGHLSGLIGDIAKVAGAFLGIQTVFEFGKSSVEAALTAQAANEKLDVALKNVHSTLTANSSAVEEQRAKLLNLGFTGAVVDDALAKATTGFGNGAKALSIMGVAADLAKFKNIDLASATLIVQKGMEGQLRPLRQLGIDLPVAAGNAQQVALANKKLADAQQAVNDLLAKYPNAADTASKHHAAYEAAVKKVAAAQDNANAKGSAGQTILDALSQRLQGQAAKAADTYAGKMDVLNAKWEETKVKIGTVVLPALGGLTDFLNNGVLPALEKMNKALDKDHGNLFQALGAGSNSKSGGPFAGNALLNGAGQLSDMSGLNRKGYNPLLDDNRFQNGWDQLMTRLGNGWSQLMGKLGTGWVQLMGKLGNGWNQTVAGFGAVFASTTNGTMLRSVGDLLGKFGNGWNQLMGKLGNGWSQLMAKLQTGWFELLGRFGQMWITNMGNYASTGWAVISAAFSNGWAQLMARFWAMWGNTMGSIATLFASTTNGNMWRAIQGLIDKFMNGWDQLMQHLGAAFVGNMAMLAGRGWSAIQSAMTVGWARLMGTFQSAWEQLLSFILGRPIVAKGTVSWSNTTPPAPSGGGGGTVIARVMAAGGIVRARPGGTPAIIGEAGTDEAVVPLTPENLAAMGGSGRGGNTQITINQVTDPVGTANAVMRRLNARGAV